MAENAAQFRTEERSGWLRTCPFCNGQILFTKLVNPDGLVPFFYADKSNDVLLRRSDIERVKDLVSKDLPAIDVLESIWIEIASNAPDAPSGGRFSLWSNIKCPSCGKEFPYNNGVRDINARIREPYIILIDGAVVVGDNPQENWSVKVKAQ